jgi:hypothetical protein
MSAGKVRRNSLSTGDMVLPIVCMMLFFSDWSQKLLELRVEWPRLSWTSTWNKLRCKSELPSSKQRIKASSVANVSMCGIIHG